MFGAFVGHVLWFFEDEWPRRPESGGSRVLRAPTVLCQLLGQEMQDPMEDQDVQNAEPQQVQNQQARQANQNVNNIDITTDSPNPQPLVSMPAPEYDTNNSGELKKEKLQTTESTSSSTENNDASSTDMLADCSTNKDKEKMTEDGKHPGLTRREPHTFDDIGDD
ncbi:hypothetical protein H4219_004791 [Mycoemilia scoparia]|uniref:Uncharacterized protein n=1 Tax=Mycoemilia scoparia TaxID=417184 RepID=A0A9W8DQJ8_9FUNG|nr:hypothetical protein H4219_004791 [Mycoemilia scoparia]